jgi:hypothetical protein
MIRLRPFRPRGQGKGAEDAAMIEGAMFERGLTMGEIPRKMSPAMSTRFFTNLGEHTLFKKFRGVFENNPDIGRFDALVGYLRSSGYFALRPFLVNVPHIRILVGINVDAIMSDSRVC